MEQQLSDEIQDLAQEQYRFAWDGRDRYGNLVDEVSARDYLFLKQLVGEIDEDEYYEELSNIDNELRDGYEDEEDGNYEEYLAERYSEENVHQNTSYEQYLEEQLMRPKQCRPKTIWVPRNDQ